MSDLIAAGCAASLALVYLATYRRDLAPSWRPGRLWFSYLLLSSVVLAGVAVARDRVPLALGGGWDPGARGRVAGMIVAALGAALVVAAKRTLGRSYSPCFSHRTPARLVTGGPYRFQRHPIYAGNLMVLAGVALGTGAIVAIVNAAAALVVYRRSSRFEEAMLARAFPGYAGYARQTPSILGWAKPGPERRAQS